MENEIRFYLREIKKAITEDSFEPTYLVTAVQLPTGAIELAVNTSDIEDKIDYILDAYDEEMQLVTNINVVVQNIMIV